MFLFDGTSDFFSTPDHADLDFTDADDFTLIAAAWTTDVTAAHAAVAKRSGANPGYHLGLTTAEAAQAIAHGVSSVNDVGATTPIRFLFHEALRVDSATIEALMNGVGSGSPESLAGQGSFANAIALTVGRQTAGGLFRGGITGAALFRRALTDAEISLVGRYLLDELA